MVFGDIEGFKVIVVKLNFRSFNDLISHTDKYITYLIDNYAHGMFVSALAFFTGHCYVYCFFFKSAFLFLSGKGFLSLFHLAFDVSPYTVCHLADHRSFLG